jgi:hypothetical protein
MPDMTVNVYTFRCRPLEVDSEDYQFGSAANNVVSWTQALLLDLKNKIREVMVFKGRDWVPTAQRTFLSELAYNEFDGLFHGIVEVGSAGHIARIRKSKGDEAYVPDRSDLAMREFFFYLELPPKSALGYFVVQRLGRNTAAPAMIQAIRQAFRSTGKDSSAIFNTVTDERRFNEYLNGRMTAVTARFIPNAKESREVLKHTILKADGLSARPGKRESVDFKFKIDRPITKEIMHAIQGWLTALPDERERLVELPVSDEPDKVFLHIETENGKTKSLHPDMIQDMALVEELEDACVSEDGKADLPKALDAAKKLCQKLRKQDGR